MSNTPKGLLLALGISLGGVAFLQGQAASPQTTATPTPAPAARPVSAPARGVQSAGPYRAVLDKYCVTCHNERLHTANLTLDKMDLDRVGDHAEIWEKVVSKLRSRTMPP